MTDAMAAPITIILWGIWISITPMAAAIFVTKQPVARVVLAAFVLNFGLLLFGYVHLGMVRLLGAVHFVFMAPAVFYAGKRLPSLPRGSGIGSGFGSSVPPGSSACGSTSSTSCATWRGTPALGSELPGLLSKAAPTIEHDSCPAATRRLGSDRGRGRTATS
jgi:hypothetical protein